MKIVVRIERLVLDGLASEPGHPARLRAALESELARLVGEARAAGWRAGPAPVLRAPGLRHARGDAPETIGRRIAACVAASLRENGRGRR
ncbi:hypothetical protein [Burkholderia sp. F1]|uniref:hypothetical protein n=1 Tax=Burkholderia sp. F1 TaxID=3366817 RepID=UPI003D763282